MYDKIIAEIRKAVFEFAGQSKAGNIWKEPLVGIIRADDAKLETLKRAVSPDHLLPRDILGDAKSVISFFLPFREEIVNSNAGGVMASREWAVAYIETNSLIKAINDKIEALMLAGGYKAGKIPATHNFDTKKLISNWSHRHIACAAGLGTFGINNMLITRNGCCGRFGSIVVNRELKEYREVPARGEKCLYKRKGSCGICRKKCAANAYTGNVFDRHACYAQCLKNAEYHRAAGYADVCGKCLVNLPCSTKEP